MTATGSEIASAYIALTVKAPSIGKDIAKELGAVDASGAGQQIGNKLANGMKKTLAATGVGIAAVLGTALVKGFGRLKAIETAQAKMRGLGYDADTVASAMDNALASVKGTAYGLGDAATVAGQLMAANIKPGAQLEGVLKTVANNAAAAGGSFDEMGSIFAKAATQANGVQNDVISQLADRGIPIYQALADQLGVTAGEVFKMASAGKIDFDTFAAAASAAAGTVADEMGNTTTGAFDNMMAALGRLGAKILEDVFPLIGPLFKDVTKWLDEATVHVEPLVEAFSNWLKGAATWLKENVELLRGVAIALGAALTATLAIKAGIAVYGVYKAAVTSVKGAILIAKLAQDGWNISARGGIGLQAAATGATKAQTFALKAGAIAQRVFNAAMNANPLMKIVGVISILVGALVWFFTKTELGQKIWGEFTRFLGEAWANVSSFFISIWENHIKPVFDGITAVATWVFKNILEPLFQLVQFGFAIMAGIFQGIWDSILKPVFDAIGAIFTWLYQVIIEPIIGFIVLYFKVWAAIFTWLWEVAVKPTFELIGAIFKWLWETIIKPTFDLIGAIFKWIWDAIISPIVNWINEKITILGLAFRIMYDQYIKPAWDAVASVIQSVWTKVKGVIDTMVRVVKTDPKLAFEAARDAIGKAWAGIQDLAKAPVKFVVDVVLGGLVDAINKIPGVSLPRPQLPKGFATGGILPGMSRMSDGDDQIIAARRGEGIMVSEALRTATDRAAFLAVNAAGRNGVGFATALQGLAKGGFVHPMPGAVVTEEYGGYPGHKGIDLAKPQGTKILAAGPGVVNFSGWYGGGGNMAGVDHGNGYVTRYKHMLRTPSVAVGQRVAAGQLLGYEGSTGDSTGPHLHWEVIKNGARINPRPYLDGAGDPGMFDIFGGLKDMLLGKLESAFPGSSVWVKAAGGLAGQGIESAIKWATSLLPVGGGIDPLLYDNGGWLQPGKHLVENRSGRPEPILTATQWDQLLDSRSGGSGVEFNQKIEVARDMDPVIFGQKSGRAFMGTLAGAGVA